MGNASTLFGLTILAIFLVVGISTLSGFNSMSNPACDKFNPDSDAFQHDAGLWDAGDSCFAGISVLGTLLAVIIGVIVVIGLPFIG
jgi:hypothetical protein